jgi:Xaa-Pro aminopeptidase
LLSAEELIEKLRGRKLPQEIERIRRAIEMTERIFDELRSYLRPGQTEREIATFVNARMQALEVTSAWEPVVCTAVDAGPNKEFGHASPTGEKTKLGHLLHFDFGVRHNGYCSDLQRMMFFGPPESIPEEVRDAFNTVREAIVVAASFIRPGRLGYEVDAVARNIVLQNGCEGFQQGLGYQVGQFAHDGGTRLAPLWELFGERPKGAVEEENVFKIELNVRTNEHGQVSLEENALITTNGCLFLSHPQEKLICIG